ncbi:replication-associated recombination protein A [bacterium]|nr:replication-associated recombination protein A [bacterium]
MRPQRLEDFIGQEHLVGEDGALLPLLTEGRLHSMIFWGEPGVGKTTLARLLANSTDAYFAQLSAVSSGVGDVRKVIDQARLQKRNQKATLLFIDEIHRFNKAQQDALLHAVEEGIIHLVGATTENPSFEVIAPLLSRARVYKFRPLERSHLETLLSRSLLEDEVLATSKVSLNDEAKDALLNLAMGDAREMYNLLERTVERARHLKRDEINLATLETVAAQALSRYDKSGDRHYDTISAFIKCVRNTDPDAAIYWLARMLHAGEDALFIARRLIILASEDIGNANPNALLLARACFDSVHKIGMPEARIILAQTTTYLASSPKSNASYQAIEEALAEVNKGKQYAVPLHLRNAPTGLMKEHGYGDGYLYSHNQEGAVSDMPGLPEELEGTRYYRPTEYGSEAQIKKRLEEIQRIRELRRSKKSSDSDKEGVEK